MIFLLVIVAPVVGLLRLLRVLRLLPPELVRQEAPRFGAGAAAHHVARVRARRRALRVVRLRRVALLASKSPLPGGFWVFLGSSRKGLAEIDRGLRVFFQCAPETRSSAEARQSHAARSPATPRGRANGTPRATSAPAPGSAAAPAFKKSLDYYIWVLGSFISRVGYCGRVSSEMEIELFNF